MQAGKRPGKSPAKSPGRWPGWLFGAVTVVPAMLAAAWLLPASPLLLAGRFSARPMVFMFAPLAVGLCYFAVRQLPASWPAFRGRGAHVREAGQARVPGAERPVPWWAVAGTVAVAVAFAAWQIAERTEQIIYLRDPSTYLEVGYWLAHHGSLPIPNSLAAFGGPHPGLGFATSNYYPRGSGIVPQFMTGTPLVLAAAIWLGGIPAALVTTPLIGGCAVLSFGGLAGAGRAEVGAGRGGHPGAEPARAVHQPRLVQRAAGPGAAVRRPVPAGRLTGGQAHAKHQ